MPALRAGAQCHPAFGGIVDVAEQRAALRRERELIGPRTAQGDLPRTLRRGDEPDRAGRFRRGGSGPAGPAAPAALRGAAGTAREEQDRRAEQNAGLSFGGKKAHGGKPPFLSGGGYRRGFARRAHTQEKAEIRPPDQR